MINEVMEEVTNIISPVYLVGGAVRDYIMGREVDDFDFCTPHHPDTIQEILEEKNSDRWIGTIGKKFGTVGTKIYLPKSDTFVKVEITTFRGEEKYTEGSRKPEVTFVTHIHQDLGRRDFTFNFIALRMNKGQQFIDPFNGMGDIEDGIIRAVGVAKQRFKEDPLRMLRAARFASTLGFDVEEVTMKRMTSGSINILSVSKERWTQELNKLLLGDDVVKGLNVLAESRLLNYMIPELAMQVDYDQMTPHHDFTLWEHTCKVVAATPKDMNLRWAALLHDVAKPFVATMKKSGGQKNYIGHEILGKELTAKILRYLKMSNARINGISEIVGSHLQDDSPLKPYDSGAQKRGL